MMLNMDECGTVRLISLRSIAYKKICGYLLILMSNSRLLDGGAPSMNTL